MKPRTLSFTVLGRPQPAGSKRVFPNPRTGKPIVTDMNPRAKSWKQEVAAVAAAKCCGMLAGPLELIVHFYMARPKGHYGTGRNAWRLKDSAPGYPIVAPDATKLLRCVEDALQGVAYRNDAQVVRQRAFKHYCGLGGRERCEVEVWELTG